MRTKIHVYPHNIKHGGRGCKACPVAQALKEQLNVHNVEVYYGNILIDAKSYKTPRQVFRFINRFDRNKPVKPFNFYLEEMNDAD